MKFDEYGLPYDNTATDMQDSCRLAGLMAMIGHKDAPHMHYYMLTGTSDSEIFRHPHEIKYSISRDQVVCFLAGFKNQQMRLRFPISCRSLFYKYQWRISKDIVSPSVRNHLRTVLLGKSTWFGRFWLKLDLKYNAWFCDVDTEQNQLIALCDVQNMLPDYVKSFPVWRESLRRYWHRREEQEFCKQLIEYVESRVK